MKIQWFGQSAFLLVSDSGLRVITDPYNPAIGYKDINETANVVTISHEHRDHNYPQTVKGHPEVLSGPGVREVKGVQFKGINTWHDPSQGAQRGSNTVFCFTIDGVRICHLGDLGHLLTKQEQESLGNVDLLLVPVGGFFTIDASEASKIVADLNPRIAIPMHYKTDRGGPHLAPVDEFIEFKPDVVNSSDPWYEVKQKTLLVNTQIVVLRHMR